MSKKELPDGWKWSTLGNILSLSSGKSRPELTKPTRNGEFIYPVYGGNGILGYSQEYLIEKPTIVLGRVGQYCGSVYISEPKSWISDNALYAKEFFIDINLKYLELALFYLNLNRCQKKCGQPLINQSIVSKQLIVLPPPEVQNEIVSKIDRKLAQIKIIIKEAEKQGDALNSLFLSYISEKFDENFPTEKLDFLVNEIKNGVYKPPYFRGKGHKLVRMYNIENDSIELNDNSLELIELTNDELENYALLRGDILISRVNSAELVGKCGVLKDKLVGYAYENMVMRVRVNSLKLIPDYLAYFLISPKGKNEIRSRARHAINQSSINNKDVGNIPVPLPPTLDIQKEIVRDLDSKFEYIQGLKNQIKIQLTAIECLKSSILYEVFGKYEIPDEA